MSLFLVFILITSSASVIGDQGKSPRIVGGQDALQGQFPYQASLQWGIDGEYFEHICGAAIISKHWLVTAGHCKTDLPGNYFQVTAGDIDYKKGDSRIVDKIIVHEEFLGGVGPHDIAVVKLRSPLSESAAIAPLQLPNDGAIPSDTATLTGWGADVVDDSLISTTLKFMDVQIIGYQECSDHMGASDLQAHLETGNICSVPADINVPQGACHGDSGSPLVQGDYLVGIVSWKIFPCGEAPSVYTQVSSYTPWIKTMMMS